MKCIRRWQDAIVAPFLMSLSAAASFLAEGTSSAELSTILQNRDGNATLMPAPVVIPPSQYL